LERSNFTYEKTYHSYACACAPCHDAPELLRLARRNNHDHHYNTGNGGSADDHSHYYYPTASPFFARLLDGTS
jgi:hypothetical protein